MPHMQIRPRIIRFLLHWPLRPGWWEAPGAAIALVLFIHFAGVLGAQAAAASGASIWAEQRRDIEDYLRTADVVKMDAIGVGVTSPRRAYMAPGGLVDSFTWKPIPPGRYKGYWESYKSEIAAYELDKHLALDMFPPAVERKVDGKLGAAVMWASPTKSFKQLGGVPRPPPRSSTAGTGRSSGEDEDNLIANPIPTSGTGSPIPSGTSS
jgi:hypothetical protein